MPINKYILILMLICIIAKSSIGYDILVVFPEPTKSHGILGDGYVRLLLEAKHKVTYITPFPWEDPPSNLTQIDISSNLETSGAIYTNLTEEYTDQATFLLMLSYTFSKMVVTHPAVQAFLRNRGQKFDAVVAEWIDSELYSSFAGYFKCPLVWAVSTQLYWQPMRIMDEVPNPAYSADVNSKHTPPLSFTQRLHELNIQVRKNWILHHTIKPLEEELYNTVFGSAAMTTKLVLPVYSDIPNKYAMMLVNSHPSVATPWRVPPSVKEIAGYHIVLPPAPLQPDLKSIMDASPQGVIYFSFGTTISGKDMSVKMKTDLLKVFRDLKQTVLWKMEVPIENLPPNVHLMKWAPQTSILSHPNTKIFITHGGMLSTIETIHFGVPIIAVPRHADQFANVDAVVKKGIAIQLDYNNDFPTTLLHALSKMLKNHSYAENMKFVSILYHNRPVTPRKELVHWVEHSILSHGASYFRSPALRTPVYQKYYLDLAAIIFAIVTISLILIIWSMCWCIRKIKKRCCSCY